MDLCQEGRQGVCKMTIELNLATVIYICSCIGVVGGAVKVLVEAKKALQKPLDEVNKKLEHYDDCLARDKRRIDQMDDALAELTKSINMLVRSNRTMLYHMEDGNHTGEIKKEIDELDAWLLEGKEYKK